MVLQALAEAVDYKDSVAVDVLDLGEIERDAPCVRRSGVGDLEPSRSAFERSISPAIRATKTVPCG